MKNSISRVLYEWLHERRIVAVVAQHMGMDKSTLSAKLRPCTNRARLSADELLLLVDAVREAGYGKELKGILHPFMEAMRGTEPVSITPTDLMYRMRDLGKGIYTLFDCAARIPKMNDEEEIRRLKIQVRTEVLPVVLQMEELLDQRLKKVTDAKLYRSREPRVEFEPQPSE